MYLVMLATLPLSLLLATSLAVDPTARLTNTTVYVEFVGPCFLNGSFDGVGGSRLRPVVIRGLPIEDDPPVQVVQPAQVNLPNVSLPVPVVPDGNVVVEGVHGGPGHQGGGGEAVPSNLPVVGLPDVASGKVYCCRNCKIRCFNF